MFSMPQRAPSVSLAACRQYDYFEPAIQSLFYLRRPFCQPSRTLASGRCNLYHWSSGGIFFNSHDNVGGDPYNKLHYPFAGNENDINPRRSKGRRLAATPTCRTPEACSPSGPAERILFGSARPAVHLAYQSGWSCSPPCSRHTTLPPLLSDTDAGTSPQPSRQESSDPTP